MKLSTISTQALKCLDNQRAILQNVILSKGGVLKFHGLDFCFEVEPWGIEYGGEDIALPFKELAKFYDAKGQFSAELIERVVSLNYGKTKLKLPGDDCGEFPEFIFDDSDGWGPSSQFHEQLARKRLEMKIACFAKKRELDKKTGFIV